MKKTIVITMSAALLISSCTSYTGTGAYLGGSFGSILGSAIGGIAGGPRGSDIGTIIGATTGAIVGAAVGDAAEQSERRQQHEYLSQRNQRIQASKQHSSCTRSECDDTYQIDPSLMIDESNSGDDRIDFDFDSDSITMQLPSYVEAEGTPLQQKLELRNVVFSDSSHDGVLSGNETGTVVFELYNHTEAVVTDVVPTVQAEKKNSYIYISPSIRVESIAPGRGIRYTATVKADRRIKDGTVKLYVSAVKNGSPLTHTTVIDIPTQRK